MFIEIRKAFFSEMDKLSKLQMFIIPSLELLNDKFEILKSIGKENLPKSNHEKFIKTVDYAMFDLPDYQQRINNMILVNGIVLFEALKTDLITEIVKDKINEGNCEISELKISINEIIQFKTLEAIQASIIEKIVRQYSDLYWENEQKKICKLIKYQINIEPKMKIRMDLYHSYRNAILHNGGKINNEIILNLQNSNLDLNVAISISTAQIREFINDITNVGEIYCCAFENKRINNCA